MAATSRIRSPLLLSSPLTRAPACSKTQPKLPCELYLSILTSSPLRLPWLSSRLDPSRRSAPLPTCDAAHSNDEGSKPCRQLVHRKQSVHTLLRTATGKAADRIERICENRGSPRRSTRAMARGDRQPEARRAAPPSTRKGLQSHHRSVSRHPPAPPEQ